MLDLRACSFKRDYKWYRLLHSKYKSPPEVFCGTYLEGDAHEHIPDPRVKTGLATSIVGTDLVPQEIPLTRLMPNEDRSIDGFDKPVGYVIGPKGMTHEDFVLTLDFMEVAGLASLVPTEKQLSTEGQAGFYFSSELLGSSPVTSRRFDTLVQTTFPSEGHRFFIRSSVSVLRAYFLHISPVIVRLCYGTRCLARTFIAIENLLGPDVHVLDQPAILDGKFELLPTDQSSTSPSITNLHNDDRPSVRLRLILESTRHHRNASPSDDLPHHSHQILFETNSGQKPSSSPGILRQRNRSPLRETATGDNPVNSHSSATVMDAVGLKPPPMSTGADFHGNSEFLHTNYLPFQENRKPTTNAVHHFCYTIELRTVRNVHSFEHDSKVYARYTYPLFGSAAPVMTLPPVSVARHQETTLSEGFCAFEFAASLPELRVRLNDTPLTVELFDRSSGSRGADELIGRAIIQLATVFYNPTSHDNDGKPVSWRYSGVANLISARSLSETDLRSPGIADNGRLVGQLSYGLVLDDRGPHLNQSSNAETDSLQVLETNKSKLAPDDVRSTAEYRTAFELELWRANEEAKFRAHLKQREQQIMATFAEEWHKRDGERETIYRKKLSEYQQLEDKLRATLSDLAVRESQLAAGEAELSRIRQETVHETERRRKDLTQQVQTQVRELECQLKLERTQSEQWKSQAEEFHSKCVDLEQEVSALRSRLTELDGRLRTSKQDMSNTGCVATVSEYQLQLAQVTAELAKLRGTLVETEKRLDEANRGRMRYKQLWSRALHEVARLKQEAESNARQTLAKREAELEHLRARYLNVEEKELTARLSHGLVPTPTTAEQFGLFDMRKQFEGPIGNTCNVNTTDFHTENSGVPDGQEAELARLIAERDELLNTGVYDHDDPIILNLDGQIQMLSTRK
ncbi:centrosomal protein CEP120 [Paragonimus westermani]|uniref:Centrosomal protein CEP120 n=1 Tax=Paragonimus westermani TaxID=34504 RepID=A0A5J4NLS4_9TREM|nr:centrosomal protein CEP120 [Paragonimus westermani]